MKLPDLSTALLAHFPTFARKSELYETAVEESYRRWPFKPGDIAIDGGAHAGRHAIPMLEAVGKEGLVVGFEVLPLLVSRLRKLDDASLNFKLVDKALWHEAATLKFSAIKNNLGFSGIKQRKLPFEAEVEELTVTATTIDTVTRDLLGVVKFIKLDLEGAEYHALTGGKGTLLAARPLVVFENGLRESAELYGYSIDEFLGFFRSINYVVVDFFGCIVDKEYWNRTLMTYMFMAIPADPGPLSWYQQNWIPLIEAVAAK